MSEKNKKSIADHMGPGHRRLMFTDTVPKVKNKRGILKRLWKYLKTYRGALSGITIIVAVTTGLSLLGPYLMSQAIDKHISVGDMPGLLRIVLLMILTYILSSLGIWIQSVWMIKIAQKTVCDIRMELFEQFQKLSLRFFDRHPHGELMSRITNDTDTISGTLGDGITQLINSILSIIGIGCIMFTLNWRLAVVSLITIPFVTLTTRFIAKQTREGFRKRQEALGKLNSLIEESITGQRVIKACCREKETTDEFEDANIRLKKTATNAITFVGVMGPFMNMYRNIGFAIIAGVGGWMVAKGMATLGVVAAFITYADQFNRPINQLAALYGTIQSALAGAERVFNVMDEVPEINDVTNAVDLADVHGRVEFDDVNFGYLEDTPILKDISFDVDPGQTIALVGSTGAGKTTIINLLTRFYDINSGSISIDEYDIRNLTRESLRKALGIVLQDTFLFTGTVRENIRYGRLDASDSEVEEAAKLANAHQFIKHLPNGYETVLSDAGNSLSQGQRQLLAIARTLLADPAILILDEATSSVDTRTEIHIQQALQRLMNGRTSFVIAHRLNTIQRADRIFVIEDGCIVEQGTHSELLAANGTYHRLYASQFSTQVAFSAS